MASLHLGIHITSSAQEALRASIVRDLTEAYQRVLRDMAPAARAKAAELAGLAVRTSNDAVLLATPKIKGRLGLVDPAAAVDAVARAVGDAVEASVDAGGLLVLASRVDYSDVLPVQGALHEAGVPWLEWLLTAGTGPVVLSHWYLPGPEDGPYPVRTGSRTGLGVMVPVGGKGHAPFSVPAEVAGTAADNWLTRAFAAANVAEELQRFLDEEFTRRWK